MTRRKAPRFARKIAKNIALSSVAEVLVHHKPPEGAVIIDASVVESLEACFKILTHI